MSCRDLPGSSAAVTIATIACGLTDKQVRSLFHALKREGAGLPPPDPEDIEDWRAEQHAVMDRLGIDGSQRASLERRLWRARNEPPDAATFHAQTRIAGLARQRAVVVRLDPRVPDPPCDPADYERGPDGRPTHVWYASYGSNMNRRRFLAYVQGGVIPGAHRTYTGSRDKSLPTEDTQLLLPGTLHFAGHSSLWDGAPAFLDDTDRHGKTLGRAYRVTIKQFDDIVAQENGGEPDGSKQNVDAAINTGRRIGPGTYGTLAHVGDLNGEPVMTFTGSHTARDSLHTTTGPFRSARPSPAYLRTIARGLRDTYHLDTQDSADYLTGAQGAHTISREAARKALVPPVVPAPRTRSNDPLGTDRTGTATDRAAVPAVGPRRLPSAPARRRIELRAGPETGPAPGPATSSGVVVGISATGGQVAANA